MIALYQKGSGLFDYTRLYFNFSVSVPT